MTRSRQALQLFEQALELSGEHLIAFLDENCGGDAELRRDVEELLSIREESSDLLPTTNLRDDSTDSVASRRVPAVQKIPPVGLLTKGTRLADRYEVFESLGAGGMGEVYRATDRRLDRDIAIKVLNVASQFDTDMHERFDREMKSVAALSHPNIVALFDVAEHDEVTFAVMEFVEGRTLRDLIADGIGLGEAVRLAHGIASGLSAAHARNIMHRDIKPENIIVSPDGHAKILDFGLARSETVSSEQELTVDSLIPGTIPYMSPEQADGAKLNCSTDIFSFGTVLFEMLTGRNPFRARTAAQTIRNVSDAQPPAVSNFVEDLPLKLISLVTSTLDRVPERRPSAVKLVDELSSLWSVLGGSGQDSAAQSSGPSLHSFPTNMPLRRVQITGREKEVSAISSRLNDHAIVTISGPGGVGKTSIALEVAHIGLHQYPGGVWLCEFAPLRESDDIAEVIAGALDGNAGTMSGLEEVVGRLQGNPTLLIFDNCEHVIDAVADLAETLSQRVPDLSILATSRESLNVAGECVCRLEGLSYEGTDSDAANLFAARAASLAGYEDHPHHRQLIEKIVTRLEGLPLAIELAAPKLAVMSLGELLHALDDQVATLRSRRRSRDRQGTIDQAIAWSFDLLDSGEQTMLLALSVFAASFTGEAAIAICGLSNTGMVRLQRLVEQSVVVRLERRGQSRYRLLEPIRQFCQARIDQEALQAARQRHAYFYATRAAVLGQGINGDHELDSADMLNVEWPDLREAISWGRKHRVAEVAVDPIVALARTIMFHLRTEAYQWLIAAESKFGEEITSRADVNWVIANGYWVMGNPDLAESYLSRSENIEVTSQSLWVKYFLRFSQNRFEESAAAAEKAEYLARTNHDDVELRWWSNAFRVCPLTMANSADPRIDEKLALSSDFVAKLDWPTGKAFLLMAKGTVAMTRRDLSNAYEYMNQAIQLATTCGNRWIESISGLIADGVADPSVPANDRLASAIHHLRSLIDMGEEAHYPLAVRSVITALVDCGELHASAKCSRIVARLRGVGDKNELSPRYPLIIQGVVDALGPDEFKRLQLAGNNLSVLDVAELGEEILQSRS